MTTYQLCAYIFELSSNFINTIKRILLHLLNIGRRRIFSKFYTFYIFAHCVNPVIIYIFKFLITLPSSTTLLNYNNYISPLRYELNIKTIMKIFHDNCPNTFMNLSRQNLVRANCGNKTMFSSQVQ